ncbi:protein ecdysoneless [Episyrphus balteatus]|uniref:protein ecdysoneless n=1 Tax=Episyrphus balteatus TaxID=286459 RepID=UPI0024851F54|nr:protein ecdysoneless [Episyrphus balteatus]
MSSTPSTSSTPTNNPTTPIITSANLEFVREEDFVEYFIFPPPPPATTTTTTPNKDNSNNEEETHLEILLQKIKSQVDQISQDYIWHKDEFNLTIRTEAHESLREEENNEKQVALPPHLHGISHYGDNIQDEWFIVHLLYEITREHAGVVARVVDADGEFLVIEAADYLPKWANPDTCEQRVYIAEGHLLLVQNSPSNSANVLPVSGALSKISQNPTLYRVSGEIQQCIDERLKEFTEENRLETIHTQIAHLPIGVASILAQRPSLIAPACRAFCERDPIDMKACRAMRFFPPEDRVRTAVKFTRCLYAMLMHSSYVPDRRTGWNLAAATSPEEYKEDLLGVKIACGFEILASQAKENGSLENDSAWRAYLKSLIAKGYFKDNLEGSAKYNQLLEDAKLYFTSNRLRFRIRPVVGKEIVQMLHSLDPVSAEKLREDENSLPRSDSDTWLDISSEELDTMLTKKYGTKKLFTPAGDMNAKEFTSNITDFLDRKSEFDGIDDDAPTVVSPRKSNIRKNASMRKAVKEHPITAPSPDQSVSFDPDAFSTHVKNFLDFVIPEDNWESNSEMSDYEDEEDLERNIEEMTNSEMHIESDIKAYMNQMDKELSKTTIGKSFEKSNEKRPKSTGEDDFDDIESFKPIDINVNTLKNMMDSYKSQVGGSGPASNLLNAMGVGMGNSVKSSSKDAELTESTV